ncbi:DUF5655 domain-containing protein [Sinomonas atrocyanea]|uniref:DUF5655 domain-containing protein n=1 Tax=Sinomonas atrocyanea TaxID=37927 RepID=UPI00277F9C1F|nr:DUF5655 domain-containing protein [Sinomonas atrocyanea]MDQ0261386.1 hypothetical protein [Sinomonas atrocyanea]MDR6622915.1 hypothetical protein [Sinomonas atrocyanea]
MGDERRTWKGMVEWNQSLLLRATGRDIQWWTEHAREQGFTDNQALNAWLRAEHGVTGYAQYAVSWEVFGYPDFMLSTADELLDGQYADRGHLRPVADAVLAWAGETHGVTVQLRKGYVSLLSPRRKFAQVSAATKTAVDVALRWDGPVPDRLEPTKVRSGDPFAWRIRLRSPEDADGGFFALLTSALRQNS